MSASGHQTIEQLSHSKIMGILEHFDRIEKGMSISCVQVFLYVTDNNDVGVTTSEIRKEFGLNPPLVTRLTQFWEQKGYFSTRIDTVDRRRRILQLTDKGHELATMVSRLPVL